MAYFIKIDDQEQHDFLVRVIRNMRDKMAANLGGYVEYIELTNKLFEAIAHPVVAEYVVLPDSADRPPALGAEAPAKTPIAQKPPRKNRAPNSQRVLPRLCAQHPAYEAKRPPRTECKDCWAMYSKLNPSLAAGARLRFERKQRANIDL